MDDYLDRISVPHVREILTNYGDVSVLWWDTKVNLTQERADRFRPLLALQPGIITNDRLDGNYTGNLDTPEQYIPATGIAGRDWESCMTMNRTWGYKKLDDDWKGAPVLLRNLTDIVSKSFWKSRRLFTPAA